MVCTFQKSCHLLILSRMLMGNICNSVITRVLSLCKSLQDESDRGLISCDGKFFKPLDWIIYEELLARQEKAL